MPIEDELQAFGVTDDVRGGRKPADGYTRGWGLEFGDLREKLLNDPVYLESFALTAGRTVQSELRRMNLYLLIKYYLKTIPRGNVVELGTYRGGSALFMASAMKTYAPGARMLAFDTFEGMPYSDKAIDAHSRGDFGDVDYDELRLFAAQSRLYNLQFVKGKFEDTLPALLQSISPIALVHIDCDVRDAVVYAYETVKASMAPGGYMVFDDATTSSCIGATEAVEQLLIHRDGLLSEQIFPHYVFRAGFSSTT